MSNPSAPDSQRMDPQLAAHLHSVAARLRATRLHQLGMRRWLVVTAVAVGLLTLRAWQEELALFSGIALTLVVLAALLHSWLVARRTPFDRAAAAQIVESQFPDLKLALRTAAEQTPQGENGRFHFLQRRVIDESLRHARRNPWTLRANRQARWTLFGHGLAIAATLAIGTLVLHRDAVIPPWVRPAMKVEVTPGNEQRERGSTVVFSARISGRTSHRVELVWTDAAGKLNRVPMSRNLGDPIYAFTLPRVSSDVTYQVAYDGGESARFKITVFDQPALVRADATLNYPKYTGLADKTIPNTRRVSAVEGTKLQYDFTVNKPLASAVLRDETGAEIKLSPANPERTKFTTSLTISATHTYQLKLADDEARANPAPTQIVVTSVENKPPTVALVFPRSDVRVSSLEEMSLSAQARANYGLLDYGLAIAVGEQAPQYVSLKDKAAADTKPLLQAKFQEMLALEPKGIKPDDLVTWFAWAEDTGPEGKPRRVTSDLAFAEVRPFEEIYREASAAEAQAMQRQQQQQQQGGQQPQAANPLLELQRQISSAIFNLNKATKPGPTYADDVKTIADEQKQALQMLQDAKADLTNSRQQAAADQAERFMNQAADNLTAAGDKKSLDPLSPAWTGAQGAYQALLKLQARETRVAQQQRGQGGQQQPRNRNQAQLDQLDFNQQRQQDNYQTPNEAQQPTTPEQREQLAVQSRLNELARRQTDVNQRLQEMQTALAAAKDEPQREQIRRELQRLEEEQRNMLADLDEARQRVDNLQPGEQTQQTRQQLDQARQDMNRTSEQLAQGNVQQALAAGTRTREQLDQTRQQLQNQSSSQFAEQMRTARQQARDLSTQQQQIEQQITQAGKTGANQLDDSAQRQALGQNLDRQRTNLDTLINNLREVTDASEATEPTLHNQLYDLLRQQAQTQTDTSNRLQAGAELIRRGFVDQSRDAQAGVAQNLDQLRQGVERAADSVLGDETQTLQFAQSELSDLARQLQQDRQNARNPAQAAQNSQTTGQQRGQGAGQSQLAQSGGEQGQPGSPGAAGQPNAPGTQSGQQGGTGGTQPGDVAQNGQPGQPGAGQRGTGSPTGGTSEDFRNQDQPGNLTQNGGQPGAGQGRAQPGGQADATSNEFAQNDSQPGGAGQQPGQRGGTGPRSGQGQRGQSGEVAQNGAGQQPGGQGQGRQGGAGQRGGQGQPGELAQNDAQPGAGQGGQPGQPGGQGQRGGQGGQRGGQGGQGGGQPGDLAQNDQNPDAQNPGQGGGQQPGQPGQRGGQGGQGGPQLAQNNGQPGQGGGQGNGQRNQNVGPRAGGGGGGGLNNGNNNFAGGNANAGVLDDINRLAQDLGNAGPNNGPITGADYAQWADRLRTVEQLIDDPNLRQQVANARGQADDLRRAYQRNSNPPQWGDVQNNVLTPLNAVRAELAKELARLTQPDVLQPADRDPVPAKFANSVSSYFEALGAGK